MPTGGQRRPLHVLIIEDSRDTADSLAVLLLLEGYTVDVAYDGVVALEAAQVHRPDAVFVDIGLPGTNGWEVVKLLQDRGLVQGSLLVAVTGFGQEADERRSQEAGILFHMTKPANPQKLLALLASWAHLRSTGVPRPVTP
jgi:DNA-binding response OmpR family regulator